MAKPTSNGNAGVKGAEKAPAEVLVSTGKASLPETLDERYALVCDRIAAAAKKAGRSASDIILVAVTKYAEPEQIRHLLQLGHRDFGENRAQVLVQHAAIVEEYMARRRMLPSTRTNGLDNEGSLFDSKLMSSASKPSDGNVNKNKPQGSASVNASGPAAGAANPVRWHMIGHLQRNKAKKVVEFVRLVHSVDSLRIAEELQAIAMKRDQPIEVLLQVNASGEESKHGLPLPSVVPVAEQIATMIGLRIRGLMTMAPYSDNPEEARPSFERTRELFEEMRGMKLTDAPFNILSMGMSGDYEVAISEGANVVRVGTNIFGENAAADRPAEAPEEDEGT
ncbi:MAG: YggS family pyridoxal phosphate-dependent enzyme [Phycisphaerae bacterium]|jgi:pyridoxal phosphate enzyme (YggS family)